MKWYVDDVNLEPQDILLGACYENEEGDMSIPGDKRAMEVIRDIENSIQPTIHLEVDHPSN